MDLSSLILGAPTDVAGFEKELNAHIPAIAAAIVAIADARDIEELIADALKRRCNCNNGRKEAMQMQMQMHLRLKMGANAEPREMTRHELGELAELVAANAVIQRLANFYARIAMLRARIEAILRSYSADPANPDVQGVEQHAEESLREKRDQTQRELDRIMRALFQESDSIHPDLTEDDLPALETQVEHIEERGTAQELRRLEIVEALLEQRRLDALLAQLRM